jgi:hypothetical protein
MAIVISRMVALLALILPGLLNAGGCDQWRLLLRLQEGDGYSLRLSLKYLAPRSHPPGWVFYGFAAPGIAVAVLPLDRPGGAWLQRLVKAGASPNGEPIYTLQDWYRPDNPLALYLIRTNGPHPLFADLGVRLEVARPTPLPKGQRHKFHGFLPPKMLVPEPAHIDGIEPDVLVCRARNTR